MRDRLVPCGDGHTALDDDDRFGLIPTYISTRGDLFEAEQRNIAAALLRPPPAPMQLLDDRYLRDLHEAMFGDVREWAGHYRMTETNIGIDPAGIATEVLKLTQDAQAWVESRDHDPDELAVRFHYRLVVIHPFANGNGRHSRIAADYLVMGLGGRSFSWGGDLDADTAGLRAAYLGALKKADDGDLEELVRFARS